MKFNHRKKCTGDSHQAETQCSPRNRTRAVRHQNRTAATLFLHKVTAEETQRSEKKLTPLNPSFIASSHMFGHLLNHFLFQTIHYLGISYYLSYIDCLQTSSCNQISFLPMLHPVLLSLLATDPISLLSLNVTLS